MKFKRFVSSLVKNKKGAGEISILLILMVLVMFLLTRYIFHIPFPFMNEQTNKQSTQSTHTSKIESPKAK